MATTISGIIAVFLLILYAYAIVILVRKPDQEPYPQVGTILSLVGALVSALVVAVLAITPPGETVSFALTAPGSSLSAVEIVTWSYLFVWLSCGAVLLFSWLRTPAPANSLASAATSWLGLAVAAAYAYLGLKTP